MNFNKQDIQRWLQADVDTLKGLRKVNESGQLSTVAGFEAALAALSNAEHALDYVQIRTEYDQSTSYQKVGYVHLAPGSNEHLLVECIKDETRTVRARLLEAELSEEIRRQTLVESLAEVSLPNDHVSPYALYALRFDPISFGTISGCTYPRLLRQLTVVSKKSKGRFERVATHGVLFAPTWLPTWLERHSLPKDASSLTPPPGYDYLQEVDLGVVSLAETELLQTAIGVWDPLGSLTWARDFNETVRTCRKIWQTR